MRIIAGKYKGHGLLYPKSVDVRPTQDRVKEALFSSLGTRCIDASVLDLCCGTGSLGLEAISRGAKSAVFIDDNVTYINKNIQKIISSEDQSKIRVLKQTLCANFIMPNGPFDLIFLDPPWTDPILYKYALNALSRFDTMSQSSILVIESEKGFKIECPDHLKIKKTYQYGGTQITLVEVQ
ncbi:MAG: 16S rRNA (guanine(966)-N(2))-methyltransferase RsmD [Actinobacteria bacterium]|nr:16S rRNA (guanine(966)-N(2))-methyltransferase RsmD [Actinomycetota bacterium]|tara:strand:+ start:837 stop:1379 length:543 start_codon:yes stop_codon:yes gene_type:complete